MLDLRVPERTRTARALTAWAVLIGVAILWGQVLLRAHRPIDIAAPPFWSRYETHLSPRVLPAIGVAALVVWAAPHLARELPWRRLLGATVVASTAWAVAMAYVDGPGALTDPVRFSRNDYLQTARSVPSLHAFLAHYIDNIEIYNQHTKGHPPGMVVFEWALDRVGLAGDWWQALLVLAGGVAAGLAVLVATREVVSEAAARVVAPFIVLVPAVIWWQTADAFYAGLSAWSIALIVLASSRAGVRGDALAIAGGLGFGFTMFCSYGLAALALLPIAICTARRSFRPLLLAGLSAGVVFAIFAAAGFSWFAGLAATRRAYWNGVARHRPYTYFFVADLAVLALATGPAVAAAFARRFERPMLLIIGSIGAIVLLADLSGMSKGEVERIWLPFVPWLMCATANLPAPAVRKWLVLQSACSLAIAVTVWSQW